MPDARDALDPGFPNSNNPALFNYDWNRNCLRDETPASTSEMLRGAKTKMLQQINSGANGLQLIMGDAGSGPQFAFDPMLNGYTFECFNTWWNQPSTPPASSSAANWRMVLDSYLRMRADDRKNAAQKRENEQYHGVCIAVSCITYAVQYTRHRPPAG
jgi:hypothetical protein